MQVIKLCLSPGRGHHQIKHLLLKRKQTQLQHFTVALQHISREMTDTQKSEDRAMRKVFFIRGVTSLNVMNAELGLDTWFCKMYSEK